MFKLTLLLVVGIFSIITYVKAQTYIDVAVQQHNYYRSLHGAPIVASFSSDINTFAQQWAEYLATTDQFYHSGGPFGENMFMSWGGSEDRNVIMAAAIKIWYDEIQYYDWNNPGFSSQTGHFTQVVWRATNEIGVGIAVVPDPTYRMRSVVCINYRPPGNFLGQFEQNVLRPISQLNRIFDNLNSTVLQSEEKPVVFYGFIKKLREKYIEIVIKVIALMRIMCNYKSIKYKSS